MNTGTTATEYVDQSITRGMRDGVEIHRAALRHGLNTRLYPRQVLEVFSADGTVQTSFTHGIPQASTLSGVTFTQDLRMARGLLKKAGIQTAKGATFSVGYSKKAALRYGDKLGYPVVVKPELGDSTIDVVRGINNHRELSKGIDTLLTPPEQRTDSTQASYGITELRKPGMKNGEVTVPPGYRFFVEEEVQGSYFRLLVLDGEVIDVLRCPGGPWSEKVVRLDTEQWPDGVCDLAAATVRAIPGLAVMSLDVVIPDEQGPDGELSAKSAVVVDVSERPWLEVQQSVDPSVAQDLANKLLRFGLDTQGGASHISPGPANSEIEARVKFLGVVDPSAFVEALEHVAQAWGVRSALLGTDEARGHVSVSMQGEPGEIAELLEVVLERGAQGHVAMRADVQQ